MEYTGERNSDGKANGQGTLTCADGRTYTGAWKDGNNHGQGTMTYANGATHTGCILWRCVGALGAYS